MTKNSPKSVKNKSQQEIEKEMHEKGVERYRSRLKGVKGRVETSNPVIHNLLANTIDVMKKAIDSWYERECIKIEKNKNRVRKGADLHYAMTTIMKELSTELISAITCRCIFDSISLYKKAGRSAMVIGEALDREYVLSHIQKDNPRWFSNFKNNLGTKGKCTTKDVIIHRSRRIKEYLGLSEDTRDWTKLNSHDKMRIGTLLIELFCQTTGLTTIENKMNFNGRKVAYLMATPTTLEALDARHAYYEVLKPLYKPCVMLPADWTTPFDGGYFDPQLFLKPLVKSDNKEYLRELEQADMQPVYDAVNKMQHTAWRVNKDILGIMLEFWEAGIEGAGIPSKEDEELPIKPVDIKTNEEARSEWRRSARDVHCYNEKNRSRRIGFYKSVKLAEAYKDRKSIYYVWQLDWRGRAYPVSYFYMQPQGPDYGKALIEFAEGKKIDTEEAKRWFFIHGANCASQDKLPLDDRVKWIEDNKQLIRNCAKDPFYYTDWRDYGDPWCFLSFCMEFVEWEKSPDSFLSYLPIAIDATQSGLQILSLLVLDKEGATETNVIGSGNPKDLYDAIAQKTTELLIEEYNQTDEQIVKRVKLLNDNFDKRKKKALEAGKKFDKEAEERKLYSKVSQIKRSRDLAKLWLDLGIDRSIVKRPTMTRVYNASPHSMVGFLKNAALEKGLDVQKKVLFPTCSFLGKFVRKAMDTKLAGAEDVMDYLTQVAGATCDSQKPIKWTMPTGLPVRQHYKKKDTINVCTKIDGHIKRRALLMDTDEVSAKKQKQAFSPNLVHSIDSALMMLVINKLPDDVSLAMIHDSYACHASDVDALSKAIKEVYAEEFSKPMLENIVADIVAHIPEDELGDMPELPEMGDLDTKDILNSTYIYS